MKCDFKYYDVIKSFYSEFALNKDEYVLDDINDLYNLKSALI